MKNPLDRKPAARTIYNGLSVAGRNAALVAAGHIPVGYQSWEVLPGEWHKSLGAVLRASIVDRYDMLENVWKGSTSES